ncbi:ABC transporter permease [Rhodocytophaga rosea]|nr:ABC transporter permease [Rhodocytophaga rosea]
MKYNNQPPVWIDHYLRWRLPAEQFEEVQGDMHELYALWVKEEGKRKANRKYLLNALTFLRPLPKPKFHFHQPNYTYSQATPFDMIRNYFTIAFWAMLRHKAFSFLNIMGLAIGMACSILILLWVTDELSYDRFHAKASQLYRITVDAGDVKAAVTMVPMAAVIQAQIPEVKSAVRLSKYYTHLLEVSERKFEEQRLLYADSNFLSVFTFPLVEGDAKTALSRPDGILLTQKMAEKYFGTEPALGKMIRKDNEEQVRVMGVLADIPANSHLQFDFLMPMSYLARSDERLKNNQWGSFNHYTYLELHENVSTDAASLQKLNTGITNIHKANAKIKAEYYLQPITNIHLHSNFLADLPGHGNIQYVQILTVVAIFILLVASINFMNLATARSARRAKEVGLRKVVGAKREHLIMQFMGESLMIAGISLVLAMVFVALLLPTFNDLSGKQLSLHFLDWQLWLGVGAIALITGLVSGSYPALFLSAFQPVKVLKGTLAGTHASTFLRNGLVVAQFVVSIVLLVGTAVVYNQLQFIQHRNMGYDKENLLYMQMRGNLYNQYQALRTELTQNPLTINFTATQDLPADLHTGTTDIQWEGKDPNLQVIFPSMAVDENFIEVMGMKILAGRSFFKDSKADKDNFIVNEKALQVMGMNLATAVGKPFSFGGTKGTIIGVVKDFNFKPIQQAIEPLVLQLNNWGGYIVIRTKPGQTEATIQALEKISSQLNPGYPFSYNFLDQDLANLYQAETRMGHLFTVFAALAIIISCLGLYGLSAFVAERRTKEISVRKVLGASAPQLVSLLSTDFLKLVLIAFVIATPLAWVAMHQWLEGFAYHIDLSWWMFALAGIAALSIALLTVSYQAIKSALANPVKSLRNE